MLADIQSKWTSLWVMNSEYMHPARSTDSTLHSFKSRMIPLKYKLNLFWLPRHLSSESVQPKQMGLGHLLQCRYKSLPRKIPLRLQRCCVLSCQKSASICSKALLALLKSSLASPCGLPGPREGLNEELCLGKSVEQGTVRGRFGEAETPWQQQPVRASCSCACNVRLTFWPSVGALIT